MRSVIEHWNTLSSMSAASFVMVTGSRDQVKVLSNGHWEGKLQNPDRYPSLPDMSPYWKYSGKIGKVGTINKCFQLFASTRDRGV